MPSTGTMDFFQYQDQARRRTRMLVVYYFIAVALIILAVYAVIVGVFYGFALQSEHARDVAVVFWHPGLFTGVIVFTTAIVLVGSLYKIHQLSTGGETVATMLGGRPVSPDTIDPNERRALNVVEEMAIASGTPVPQLFVLDDEVAINAFAAGFSTRDAVVGITRGAIDRLTRDELQGVVAHEFSHVLNGDMRLNIKLIGILNGILIIGLIGFWTMRLLSQGRSRSSRDKGGIFLIVIAGFLIWIVGSVGVFFAKLIKSAVSRQREYLADASSVQFTRNPAGLAGALRKIGGLTAGSRLLSEHTEEASHIFFANGLGDSFLNMMATHPPLPDRIKRIDPSFDGSFAQLAPDPVPAAETPARTGRQAPVPVLRRVSTTPDEVIKRTGAPTLEHILYAGLLVQSFPPAILELVRSSAGAILVVYGFLLSEDAETGKKQHECLRQVLDADSLGRLATLRPVLKGLSPELRLPLMNIAVSSLKGLDEAQYRQFHGTMQSLIGADNQTDLFEYTVHRMVDRNLDPLFNKTRPPVAQYYDIKPLLPSCAELLSCIAYWGHDDHAAAASAFNAGAIKLGGVLQMKMADQCGLTAVDRALNALVLASPAIRRTVLGACVACVSADGNIRIEEAELLRAVADSLDCPLPPFLPGQITPAAAGGQ
ncbi:MAG: Zn-dependent protease with chaperone function [Verrucomicrobia bacterium]|nr:Zn-dependent protease with chaperone function [Verrucomicrobiota bacterium]